MTEPLKRVWICVLGSFRFGEAGGKARPMVSKKAEQLIGYLATRDGQHESRTQLAALLWPDSEPETGRANLRRMLTKIRTEAPCLSSSLKAENRDSIVLDPSDCRVDVTEFVRLAEKEPWEAVQRYTGHFLAEHDEPWIETIRGPLWQSYLRALEQIPDSVDPRERMRRMRVAWEEEPFRETLLRRLILAMAQSGDLSGARHAYNRFAALLKAELNAAPSAETSRLAADLHSIRPIAEKRPNNLPSVAAPIVGRGTELEQLLPLLSSNRLLTLTGSGGIGKTTLAIALGQEALGGFQDGVWLVELAALSDSNLALQEVASVLRLPELPFASAVDRLVEGLKGKEILLVLDNCEHLTDTCANLAAELLRNCTGVKVLATSRELLRVAGESAYRVPVLSLPVVGTQKPEELERSEAVYLFLLRVRAHTPGFALTAENGEPIARICRRLDGLPLAIELAAARVRSLSVHEIDELLDQRFRILAEGNRSAPLRHQSLRTLIDWSYELLEDKERLLWARLSVFSGGFFLKSAESVCAGEVIREDEVLGLLGSLVDKSILVAENSGWLTRFRLLETLREYGRDRLDEVGEVQRVLGRHRDFFVDLAETTYPRLVGPEQASLSAKLAEDRDNFRQALSHCLQDPGNAEQGLRLAAALSRCFWTTGSAREGRDQLEAQLAVSAYARRTRSRAEALSWAAWLASWQGDNADAKGLSEEALGIWGELKDRAGIGRTVRDLGHVGCSTGDYEGARRCFLEGLQISMESGDKNGMAISFCNLGLLTSCTGELEPSRGQLQKALDLDRELGDRQGEAVDLLLMGNTAFLQREYAEAKEFYEMSLELVAQLGNTSQIAALLLSKGLLAMEEGELSEARGLLREGVGMARDMGSLRQFGICLEYCARFAALEEQFFDAARLWGAAEGLREATGLVIPPLAVAGRDEWMDRCREALGVAAFEAAWERGRKATPVQAMDTALAALS